MTAQIIIPIIVAIFGSTGFWTWIMNRGKTRRLLLGLAYSDIVRGCEKYIARGYITADEFDDLNRYLYEPYKELGGDGTVEKMMQAVKGLPTRKAEEHAQIDNV